MMIRDRLALLTCLLAMTPSAGAFAAEDDIVVDGRSIERSSEEWVPNGAVLKLQHARQNLAVKIQAQQVQIQVQQVQVQQLREAQLQNAHEELQEAQKVRQLQAKRVLQAANANRQVVFVNANGAQVFGMIRVIDRSSPENFERLIFPQEGNAQRARWRMNSDVARAIQELDNICQLTDAQKEKLEKNCRAQRERFFKQVEETRLKIGDEISDELQPEIRQLQTTAANGILDPHSFFRKSCRFVLTSEQLAKFDEYHQSKYRDSIELVISDIEQVVTLTAPQRDALVRLIPELVPSHAEFGNAELVTGSSTRLVILYKLSLAPDEKLKPLFDSAQWKALRTGLNTYQQFERHLIQKGLIADRGDENLGDQSGKESK